MLIDYERLLLDLKRRVLAKSHHGQKDLLLLIATLEAEYSLEEGLPEKVLRLYGVELSRDLLGITDPPSTQGRVPDSDGSLDRASRGDSNHESEEDTDDRSERSTSRAAVAA